MQTRPGKGALYRATHVTSVPHTVLLFIVFWTRVCPSNSYISACSVVIVFCCCCCCCCAENVQQLMTDVYLAILRNVHPLTAVKINVGYYIILRYIWIFSSRTALRCSYNVIDCGNTLCYCWHFCTCYRTLSILLGSAIIPGMRHITTFRSTTVVPYDYNII